MVCPPFAGQHNAEGSDMPMPEPSPQLFPGRGAAIRTRDLLNPIQVRYRAALRPVPVSLLYRIRPILTSQPVTTETQRTRSPRCPLCLCSAAELLDLGLRPGLFQLGAGGVGL